jgi:enterochelin esterase-like enzyme
MRSITLLTTLVAFTLAPLGSVVAQTGASDRRPPAPVTSPVVSEDRKITFRIHAPKAEAVRLSAGDIPGVGRGTALTKSENGVWEVTVGPVEPGSYRYRFSADGISIVDPRNPATSESNDHPWSLVHVPGAEWQDTKQVPHGAVAAVTYWSETLKRHRRMHIYTPPGYEISDSKYPVLYLLHGASDSDNSWSTAGRAGFILDNLIAAKKARPMIVVMPAGHTGPFSFGQSNALKEAVDTFVREFLVDIMPHAEKTYRIDASPAHRALAGLSLGGAQTLNIAVQKLDQFAHIGVFSSGIFGIAGGSGGAPADESWEEKNRAILDNADLKKHLKLLWFGTGKEDFLLDTTRATVAMLKRHQFEVTYEETPGGHTWLVWRQHLRDFVPRLFQ